MSFPSLTKHLSHYYVKVTMATLLGWTLQHFSNTFNLTQWMKYSWSTFTAFWDGLLQIGLLLLL